MRQAMREIAMHRHLVPDDLLKTPATRRLPTTARRVSVILTLLVASSAALATA